MILDVVYNHTAEGNQLGRPCPSRASTTLPIIDWPPDQRATTSTIHGTGIPLNLTHQRVLQLVTDSLRYWAKKCTWTDSASTSRPILAREPDGFDEARRIPRCLRQDPISVAGQADCRAVGSVGRGLSSRSLSSGLGRVERPYRDTVRRLLERRRAATCGTGRHVSPARATCSIAAAASRGLSINFLTAHDGFTLNDLVSYNDKHNEANGEGTATGIQKTCLANSRCGGTDRRPC